MVVPVTLGFMLYTFVRLKDLQKRPIKKVNFPFEWRFCSCVCITLCALKVCVSAVDCAYIYIFVLTVAYILTYIPIFQLSVSWKG